jgi:CHAD domain-containing protein
MTAQKALAVIMSAGARDFGRYLRVLMTTDDPEGPHKSRVALRRLEAALVAFKPIVAPKVLGELKRDLKGSFKIIGQVRDADVLAHDVGSTETQDGLLAAARRTRRRVRKQLRDLDATRLEGRIVRWFRGKGWRRRSADARAMRHAPVVGLAASALGSSWSHCLAKGAALGGMSPHARHALRKSLKTFRYLCEHFGGLWPSERTAPFLEILRVLQDDLGRLNDLAMARAKGLAIVAPQEDKTLRRADAAWKTLAASVCWWT